MDFRQRLLATVRAIRPVLDEGCLIIGSEVPNLLQGESGVPVIVSKDVDVGVEVSRHTTVKAAIPRISGYRRSPEAPSVLVSDEGLLEVNFVGIDPRLEDHTESYVLEDDELPLLVFGTLSLLRPGPAVDLGACVARLPELSTLLVEKLLTERSSVKGERDLLVALALLLAAAPTDLESASALYRTLPPIERQQIRSNLTLLSLMTPIPEMPDPRLYRAEVVRLLKTIETAAADDETR